MTEIHRVVHWTSLAEEPAPHRDLMKPVWIPDMVTTFNKPHGGLWTSPEQSDYPWEQWAGDNGYGDGWLGRKYVLTVEGEPKILVCDGPGDLQEIWEGFGRTGKDLGMFVMKDLDWVEISRYYDAFYLTVQGHFSTRMGFELNTYAWDCETVFWFNWCFDTVEEAS